MKEPTFTPSQLADIVPVREPTPEEAKNGWTTESLTQYAREMVAAEQRYLNPVYRPKHLPKRGGIPWAWQPRRCRGR